MAFTVAAPTAMFRGPQQMGPNPPRESPVFATRSGRTARAVALLALPIALAACEGKAPPARAGAGASSATPAAPDSFRVAFATSAGPFTVAVTRALSPRGADRFYQLVTSGYFTNVRFFRVVPGFVAQFGLAADPALNKEWSEKTIADDPVQATNAKGTIVFATAGPNTRSNQFFINLVDNARLDKMGFSPFGKVIDGMDAVDKIYSGYGEAPDQGRIGAEGNAYLTSAFPKLDYITSATIVADTGKVKAD
jgi:peptidyl-prolyl cis-trans isomerase A (cyclophilin A)